MQSEQAVAEKHIYVPCMECKHQVADHCSCGVVAYDPRHVCGAMYPFPIPLSQLVYCGRKPHLNNSYDDGHHNAAVGGLLITWGKI